MGVDRDPSQLLTIADYLREQGLTPSGVRRMAPIFGRLVKRKYIMVTGRRPLIGCRYMHGHMSQICLYRERDRHLFDLAWAEMWFDIRITFRCF